MSQTQARRNLIARSRGEHCHDYPQLMLGWRGAMDYEFSQGGGRLELGQLAIVPQAEPHTYAGRQDDSEVLVIDLDEADPCLASLEQACELPLFASLVAEPRRLSLPPSLLPMVDFAAAQLGAARGPRERTLVNHQLAMMFVAQCHQLIEATTATTPGHRRLCAEALNRFIDARLATPPDNRTLAEAMHLGHSQLHLLCQRQFGVTPQQYVMRRRLQWARHWLCHTQRPIGELALELGFAEVSSFSRAFRRATGQSPSQMRKPLAAPS